MSNIDVLVATEEIKSLKARHFRCIDAKDWEGLAAVFAPDAQFDISEDIPGCVVVGRDKILETVRPPLTGCVSVHHGHCPEITITSDTTATGIWAMEDMLRWNEDAGAPIRTLHGYGHYIEAYRKIDGAWHIQTMTLTRLRVDTTGWDSDNQA